MPGVSSSKRAAIASLELPMPDIVDVRGAGPKRATVGGVTALNSGSLSVDGVMSGAGGTGAAVGAAVAGAPGAAEPAPAAGAAAEPAPAAGAAAEPFAAAAEPAAGGGVAGDVVFT